MVLECFRVLWDGFDGHECWLLVVPTNELATISLENGLTMNIVTKLSDDLLLKLKTADELWVAVGLISLDGLNFLLRNTPMNCTRNFLLGVDLPTDPNAPRQIERTAVEIKPKCSCVYGGERVLSPQNLAYKKRQYFLSFYWLCQLHEWRTR